MAGGEREDALAADGATGLECCDATGLTGAKRLKPG